ncbi:type II secretion system protein M [Pseudomonas sp. TH08]|uniref:type II secretion system protein GspM n=1 Tax=unclassified Pseudomonas TaxID=196821 RepID=UPI0019142513|nr:MULTISPECIES: type II secretion system protein GspM [unclassified Pseudomonas]MBK5526154.1 type II secretion system protein M [Pseudomonas sp. TH06]MBK5532581.1 type II secretion system protein M [Pseudomonas sp. TH08]
MKSYLKLPPVLQEKWQQLPRRDQKMLVWLGIFLIVVLMFSGLWQPAQQRLAAAERLYQQRLALALQVQRALPSQQRPPVSAPLSARLSDSALAQGLDLEQFEADDNVLRITLRGNAQTLLKWLEAVERAGAQFESLSLDKKDQLLEAQLVVRAEPS